MSSSVKNCNLASFPSMPTSKRKSVDIKSSPPLKFEGLMSMGYKGRFGQNTFSVNAKDQGVSSYLRERMLFLFFARLISPK